MARQSKKLSAIEVSRINEFGKHPLGDSLYLQVSKSGTKSWLFRYSIGGKSTWMGLGSTKVVSLGDARTKALEFQRDILNGHNPLNKRSAAEKELQLKEARKITFSECATQYIDAHKPSWKNAKHISQWENTLSAYAFPAIGGIAVQDVDTTLLLKVLEPIWYVKAETANRLRGRIERILSWAAVRGFRSGVNPAQWRGHLDQLLPKRSTIQKIEHFKALPFGEMGQFMEKLHCLEGNAPLALEFVVLTAVRTNEGLGARWEEINESEKCWTVPAERMKAGKEHRVPLSDRALEILNQAKEIGGSSSFVFPGARKGRPLSNMALLMVIRRMGHSYTTHGFRSSFRDWASECTNFPREVVEMALAHTIKNKVEAAYRRGNLFEKRRKLMNEWARHCLSVPQKKGQLINLSGYQST